MVWRKLTVLLRYGDGGNCGWGCSSGGGGNCDDDDGRGKGGIGGVSCFSDCSSCRIYLY